MWASSEARPSSFLPPRLPPDRIKDRKLNGVGSTSPGCTSNRSQSIVRPIQPRRSPRLQPALPQPQLLERFPQQNRSRLPTPSRRILLLPTMNQPIQKSPRRNNRRPCKHHPSIPQLQPPHDSLRNVISTGAKDSLTVRSAAERPLYFGLRSPPHQDHPPPPPPGPPPPPA